MTDTTTHHRICPLCEACCGLEIKVQAGKVISIRGHEADVFSAGYICPKGVALKDLHEDPDRLRTPLIKRDGAFVQASWEEAFAEIARRLPPLMAAHGRNADRHRRGQPVGPQDRPAHLFRQAGARAGHEERVFRLHAGPDAQAARQRADVRPLAVDRPARHRPHRLPAGAGRQPPGEQRQHVDRARLQGQGQGAAGARRQAGGDRPAPHRDRRRGRRAPLHPPERRRVFAGGHGATPCLPKGW